MTRRECEAWDFSRENARRSAAYCTNGARQKLLERGKCLSKIKKAYFVFDKEEKCRRKMSFLGFL